MQKKWFSACLEHPGRPGVDHAAGPHSHSQLELGHPAPLREGTQLPVCHKPGHSLPPASLVPNLLTHSPASDAAREGRLARLKTGQRRGGPPGPWDQKYHPLPVHPEACSATFPLFP